MTWFINLSRRTVSNTVKKSKIWFCCATSATRANQFAGCNSFATHANKFAAETVKSGIIQNKEVAKELHKPIIGKF